MSDVPVPTNRDPQIELIFSGAAMARLLVKDGICVCGPLAGPMDQPSSHDGSICPIGRFYAAADELAKVGR